LKFFALFLFSKARTNACRVSVVKNSLFKKDKFVIILLETDFY